MSLPEDDILEVFEAVRSGDCHRFSPFLSLLEKHVDGLSEQPLWKRLSKLVSELDEVFGEEGTPLSTDESMKSFILSVFYSDLEGRKTKNFRRASRLNPDEKDSNEGVTELEDDEEEEVPITSRSLHRRRMERARRVLSVLMKELGVDAEQFELMFRGLTGLVSGDTNRGLGYLSSFLSHYTDDDTPEVILQAIRGASTNDLSLIIPGVSALADLIQLPQEVTVIMKLVAALVSSGLENAKKKAKKDQASEKENSTSK